MRGTAGLDLEQMQTPAANLFCIRGSGVRTFVHYWDRTRACRPRARRVGGRTRASSLSAQLGRDDAADFDDLIDGDVCARGGCLDRFWRGRLVEAVGAMP